MKRESAAVMAADVGDRVIWKLSQLNIVCIQIIFIIVTIIDVVIMMICAQKQCYEIEI